MYSANQATGEQPRALAAAVHAYAANIDNLGALGDAVNKIAQKHCSYVHAQTHHHGMSCMTHGCQMRILTRPNM